MLGSATIRMPRWPFLTARCVSFTAASMPLKYGMIASRPLFDRLAEHVKEIFAHDPDVLVPAIEESCRIKARVVEAGVSTYHGGAYFLRGIVGATRVDALLGLYLQRVFAARQAEAQHQGTSGPAKIEFHI